MSKQFPRHRSSNLKRLSTSWRKPRGLDSKVRLQFSGYLKKVKIGHGSKANEPVVIVSSEADLKACKGMKAPVVISNTVGQKKKAALAKLAAELSITLHNVPSDYVSKVEENLANRKKVKASKSKAKEQKQKELSKEADKKAKEDEKAEKLDSKVDEKERKEQEKREKDKLLTSKDSNI